MSSEQQEEWRQQMQMFMQPGLVLNPDQYASAMDRAARLKELAANLEQRTQAAHNKYLEQQLRQKVEEGERARSVQLLGHIL